MYKFSIFKMVDIKLYSIKIIEIYSILSNFILYYIIYSFPRLNLCIREGFQYIMHDLIPTLPNNLTKLTKTNNNKGRGTGGMTD